ncbi:MAG: CBS domain-containing protein [Rhodospirillaceae bacterium]|nr:CBS domain-containing protein [Rhodospirillaceae bacterium]
MKVRDVMHKGAVSVKGSDSLKSVAKKMRRRDIGAIPVKKKGRLVGMITDRDLVCRVLAKGGNTKKLTAGDVMTEKAISCRADDNIEAAVRTMETKKIRRLPVLDSSRKLVGMVSLGDISHRNGATATTELLRAVTKHHVR